MALHRLLDEAYTHKKHKRWGDGMRSTKNSAQNSTQNLSQNKQDEPNTAPTPPVVVCIGSDLAIGDSLGPITGSMLQYKTQGLNAFIYGTLTSPVTAKEIRTLRTFLRETHRGEQILAIDAAVGEKGDIGLIKLHDSPLLPGAGANKKLGAIGDVSIMAVVAEKSVSNYSLLNTTRLNLVYTMSEIISDAVATLLWERCSLKNNRREKTLDRA